MNADSPVRGPYPVTRPRDIAPEAVPGAGEVAVVNLATGLTPLPKGQRPTSGMNFFKRPKEEYWIVDTRRRATTLEFELDSVSWLVYPVRVPVQVAASVAVSYAVARHALPAPKPLPEWLARRFSWLLGTCLFTPEYAITRALLDAGKAQPVVLRVYGHWVENLTDWLTDTGKAAGASPSARACPSVSSCWPRSSTSSATTCR
ncbi:hypothetical protein [Streptomyces adelaidensis]|uniref:hypothetical protein n=1 Tax=Streptomyces adelaidensis TaxID=2796465 RepID=UPI001908BFB4|nr:hypothetical protein [Streptomyces adelaidensis]